MAGTFCTQCYVGIVTAGDASGANSQEPNALGRWEGDGERAALVQRLASRGKLLSQEWPGAQPRRVLGVVRVTPPMSGPSAAGQPRRACKASDVFQSTLVAGCLDGTKQEAAKALLTMLSMRGIGILPSNVWLFDDRADNIHPFQGSGMNARQISCASRLDSRKPPNRCGERIRRTKALESTRDHRMGTGVCGATNQEIQEQPGVKLCGREDELVVCLTSLAHHAPRARGPRSVMGPTVATEICEGSKLPSLEATEDIGSRACETHSSLGATAMESELKVIADRREKLGDTLSTQEVLAQQVASHKNAEPVAQVQERKVRASVRELVKNGRLRQSASCRRALPPLTRRAVMVELYARKAVDRRRELSHGRGA
ncbi:unnamed protein product [Effrenium voratum]|nr:unnamed protein product [Effrenium voratum]